MIHCDKHVFAHRGHYRTLLSSDSLQVSEIEQLEQYHFGQTNDPTYLESLRQEPGLMLHRLKSSRFALTRVVKGPLDAGGRSTLAFVSLVFPESAWLTSIASNLISIVQLPGTVWDGRTPVVDVQEPQPLPLGEGYSVRLADDLVAQYQAASAWGASLLCFSDTISLRIIAHVAATAATEDLQRFSFAYRALSDAVPVGINVLDRRYTPSGTASATKWFEHDNKISSKTSLVYTQARTPRPFGDPIEDVSVDQSYKEPVPMDKQNKQPGEGLLKVVAVMSLLTLFAVALLWMQAPRATPGSSWAVATSDGGLIDRAKQIQDSLNDVLKNASDTERQHKEILEKQAALEQQVRAISGKQAEFEKLLSDTSEKLQKSVADAQANLEKKVDALKPAQKEETGASETPSQDKK